METIRNVALLLALLSSVVCYEARATNLVTTASQGSGLNWTAQIWSNATTATISNVPSAGNTYEVISNGLVLGAGSDAIARVRNPATDGTQQFPGDSLTINAHTDIRFKKGVGGAPISLTVSHFPGVGGNPGLILNGGVLNPGDEIIFPVSGSVRVASDSILGLADSDVGGLRSARGLEFRSAISGSGALITLQGTVTNIACVNVTSSNNTYSGNWIVKAGFLKGTGSNSLGAADITLDSAYSVSSSILSPTANAALAAGPVQFEADYNIDTPGTLTVNGSAVVVLHQDWRFARVFVDGSQVPNGTYPYAAIAAAYPTHVAAGGSGSISVGPAAPTGLTAQSGDTQALLTWNSNPGATGYVVKVSTTTGGPYTIVATNGTSTTYLATGLVNGTTYYFVVSELNSGGESADSNEATVTPNIVAPAITADPQSTTNCTGTTASFSVTATGHYPLVYQWYYNTNTLLANQTNSTLTIANVQFVNAGTYHVVVTNSGGSATSAVAILEVKAATVATGPANQTNCPGTTAIFTTTATGAGTLTYTWYKNGAVIQGPDGNNTYTIATVAPADAGSYAVSVVGDCNTASNNFTFVVAPAPIITAQPQNQATPMGNGAVFSVTALTTNAGAAPLSYQWKTNGVDVTGATASTFAISNLTLAANGMLVSVGVTNCAGGLVSSAATLTVTPITAISFDFDTRGQYTNAPYNLVNADWHNTAVVNAQPFGPIVPHEVSTGGVGVATGGGGIDFTFNNGTVNSSILHPITYDFSLPGKTLVASAMMKIKVPVANVRNTQIGFTTLTNADLDNSAGRAYMTVILESLAQPGLGFDIRQGTKPLGANTFFEGNSNSPAITLSSNNWYRLTATFVNTSTNSVPAAAGTYTVAYTLENMGSNGLITPIVVASVGPVSITNVDVTASRNLFFVLRGQENCGLDYWDNVFVYATSGNVAFVQEIGNQSVLQGRTASFRALVDGTGPYTYVWSKNGTPIPGAGNWKYTTPALTLADNGAEFSVTVTSPNNSVSSTSVVSIVADDLAVLSVGSVDGAVIGLRFNQAVDKTSAETAANYTVNGTAAVAAQLRSFPYNYAGGNFQKLRTNETEVLITPTAPISGAFTVTVASVTSISGTAIGPNNSATGVVAGLTGFDVDPNDQLNGQVQNGIIPVGTYPGQNYSFAPNQFEVSGGGHDIFGVFDGFRFVYKQLTGDFDVKVHVPYLDLVRTPNKGGLMARVSLDASSPMVGAYPNPMFPGLNRIEGGVRSFYNQGASAWGNNPTSFRYPDTWVRLRRVGNTFIRYSSTNGINWSCDGQISPASGLATMPFPDTLYFGLAVDFNGGANVIQQLVTAQFDSYGDFGGYPGAVIAITTQPVNLTTNAGSSVILSVTNTASGGGLPTSAGEVSYLWQRSNVVTGTWTNMPTAGGTNNTVNSGPLFGSDNGAKFRVIISAPGALSVTSSVATVTVTDTAAPTVASTTVPPGLPNQVVLVFSEPLSDTALNIANYSVTNGAGSSIGVIGASFLNGDRRTVVLTLSGATTGGLGVTINGVQDLNGVSIAANTKRTFGSSPTPTGPVVIEEYGGLATTADLTALTNNVKFLASAPDWIIYSNSFAYNGGTAVPTGPENYGQKVYTYFVPPTNGAYKFWLRGDDFLRLFINTNNVDSSNPTGRVMAINMGANNANYAVANSFTSAVLNAGQAYYMEVLWKETGGGDAMSLAIRSGGDTATPAQAEMAGANLFAYPSGVAPRIVSQVEIYTNLFNTGQNNVSWKPDNRLIDLSNALTSVKVIGRTPDILGYNKVFGVASNLVQSSAEHYLGRVFSYFIAPSNGAYKFYLRSDDASQLLMNTAGTDPAGATIIGERTAFTANYTLVSSNITLTGGERYYLEARWKEGTGGDGAYVAVRSQSDVAVPANTEIINVNLLEFPTNLASTISQPRATILPLNPTITDGQFITFSGDGFGNAYIWLKNGQQVMVNNELNSTRPTPQYYRTPPLTLADDGAIYALFMTNNFGTAIATSRVTVLPDSSPVSILTAVASQYRNAVVVTFNKPVTPLTAQGLANYSIPGLQIYAIDYDDVRRDRVVLRTSSQAYNTLYTLTVNGVRDFSTTGNPAAGATKDFHSWGFGGVGAVLVEAWTNIQNSTEAFLETDPLFVNNMPDFSYYTNVFSAGVFAADSGREFWGVRISGLFMPPSNGLYRFFTRGDDGTALYMNTNGPDASQKVLIAFNNGANSGVVPPFTSPYQGGTPPGGDSSRIGASISPILSLTNGTPYYLEALMKEGGGGDYITIVMRAIDPTTGTEIGGLPTAAAAADAVGGGFFGTYGNPDLVQLLVISSPPTELFVNENDEVNLQLVASAIPASLAPYVSYQWARSNANSGVFTNIPGATGGSLSPYRPFFVPIEDDGAAYRVTATLPGQTVSYTTLLHVMCDNGIGPMIVSASTLDGVHIGIRYNEPVDINTAGEGSNYAVNNGAVNVLQAVVRENIDARTVLLTVDQPVTGTTFTLDALSIGDRASAACGGPFYNDNIGAVGTIQNLIPFDVGAPAVIGSSFTTTNGEVDVEAGGADIWGTADQGHLTLGQRTGNFDIWARVDSLTVRTPPNSIDKAGLMVREDPTNAASKTIHMLVNPPLSLGGRDLGEAAQRPTPGAATVAWPGSTSFTPAGIPNAWLRFKRADNTFTAFRSSNGVDWVVFANTTVIFSNTVYVGLATTAHNNTPPGVIAKYRNIHIPNPPTITVQPTPAFQMVPIHSVVSYSVTATNPPNSGPLGYQWRKNGVFIPNETNTTLSFANAASADSGIYTVDAYNDGGASVSIPVTLVVSNAPPVVGTDSLSVTQNMTTNITASFLLSNDSDPEMDPLSIAWVSGVAPVTYARNFDDGLTPTGGTVYSNGVLGASVKQTNGAGNGAGYLEINPDAGGAAGSFIIDELTLGKRVSAFTASFYLKVRAVTTPAQPADGFSFNFGNDLASGPGATFAAEQGSTASGFSFCLDNYQFFPLSVGAAVNAPGGGTANSSGMKINYKGVIIAGVEINQFARGTAGSAWNIDRWVPVSITVLENGACTIFVDGTNVFGTITLPNFTPTRGRFGFYGRTGGLDESHAIDDLSITIRTIDTANVSSFNAGGPLYGTADVNSGFLHLTDALNGQAGSFVLNELTPGSAVNSFTASFGLRIGNGTGNAADGLSFNFANDLPNSGSVTAPVPGAAEEGGTSTGLAIGIDNYPTGGADAPSFKLKYGGTLIVPPILMPKWSSVNFIPVSISLASDGKLTLTVDGTNVVTALQTAYAPTVGRFGLYARTGGENETHWVDDLSISVNGGAGTYANDFNQTFGPGTVTLTNGVVTYTPPPNGCGSDAFYYGSSDGQVDGVVVGQVNISITETNPVPPVITRCATNRVILLYNTNQTTLPNLTGEVVASDCGSPVITQNPVAGTVIGAGTNLVELVATDSTGLSATCSVQVVVQVVQPQFITSSLSYSGGTFSGSFQTVNGISYRVEYKDDLNAPSWTLLTTITGDGTVKTFSDPGPLPPTRFYRIVPQ